MKNLQNTWPHPVSRNLVLERRAAPHLKWTNRFKSFLKSRRHGSRLVQSLILRLNARIENIKRQTNNYLGWSSTCCTPPRIGGSCRCHLQKTSDGQNLWRCLVIVWGSNWRTWINTHNVHTNRVKEQNVRTFAKRLLRQLAQETGQLVNLETMDKHFLILLYLK